jgi:putative addiction module killer protein
LATIKQLAENLWELRFDFSGGIRIYYTFRDNTLVLLLHGGAKARQSKDIDFAKRLLEEG